MVDWILVLVIILSASACVMNLKASSRRARLAADISKAARRESLRSVESRLKGSPQWPESQARIVERVRASRPTLAPLVERLWDIIVARGFSLDLSTRKQGTAVAALLAADPGHTQEILALFVLSAWLEAFPTHVPTESEFVAEAGAGGFSREDALRLYEIFAVARSSAR